MAATARWSRRAMTRLFSSSLTMSDLKHRSSLPYYIPKEEEEREKEGPD